MTAQDHLTQIDKLLDEYNVVNKIPTIRLDDNFDKYINLSKEELAEMSNEERDNAAYILGKLSYHLQTLHNREVTRINWCEANLKKTFIKDINQYKAYSFEERKLMAINGNEYALKLDQLKREAQCRADRLGFLSTRVEFIAKSLRRNTWKT